MIASRLNPGDEVRVIVFGRLSCGMTIETITDIVQEKVPKNIPIVFGADFGHVFPMFTFPIGGTVKLTAAEDQMALQLINH